MGPDAWARVSAELDRLLALTAPERDRQLEELRKTDPDLAHELASLLAETESVSRFETPPSILVRELPTAAATDPTFPNGQAGPYVILGEIARGGMGVIYRARDPDFDRTLAVKVLLPRARLNPDAERWFDREATLMGRLAHPGIPPVHARGKLPDGTPYFAMKLVEGQTLAALMAEQRGDWAGQRIGIFEQVCRAIAFAHRDRVIHRDLKPGNVMVGAFGEVQVMDWGLAVALDGNDTSQTIAGTPAFMAPEQARGESVDERCDVFGLGALLVALATGRPPYVADSPQDVMALATRGETAPALARIAAAGIDADLMAIATRCLQSRAADRYPHAGAVADAVTAYREGLAEKLRKAELDRAAAVVKAAEERRRRRVVAGLAASLLLLVAGAVLVGFWADRVEQQRRGRADAANTALLQALEAAQSSRQEMLDRLADPASVHLVISDLSRWRTPLNKMIDAVHDARTIADREPTLTDSRLLARLKDAEETLERDRADLAFAESLDSLRLNLADVNRPRTRRASTDAMTAYEQLFASRGDHVIKDGALQLDRSPIRRVLAAALDDWAHEAMSQSPPAEQDVRTLLDVARRLDPDPWRDRYRQWDVWSDPNKLEPLVAGLNPSQQSPQVLRGLAARLWHFRRDAVALLQKSLIHYPSDFWLQLQLGEYSFGRDGNPAAGNVTESIAAYRAAHALRPSNVYALNHLGTALGARGDMEEAAELFRRANALQPDYTQPYVSLGKMLFELKRYDEAIASYQQALQRDPNDVVALNNLGAAHGNQRNFDAALQAFDKALAISKDFAPAVANKKQALEERDKHAAVVARERTAADSPAAVLAAGIRGALADDDPFDHYVPMMKCRRDAYRVELNAGQPYLIDLTAEFDPVLRIETDSFRPIHFNEDMRPGDKTRSRLVFTPETTGRYRIIVNSARFNTFGSYTLQVRPVERDGPPVIRTGRLERDDPLNQGRRVRVHPITLPADRPVSLTLTSPDFRTLLRVLDTERRTLIATNEWVDPDRPTISQIHWTPAAPANVSIQVLSAQDNRVGSYTLTVQTYKVP